jgi:hypothetical protein
VGPRDLVNARGVAATRIAAGGIMRLNTAISAPYHLVSESHHLTRNCYLLRSLLLQLRTPINPDQMGLIAGCPRSRF